MEYVVSLSRRWFSVLPGAINGTNTLTTDSCGAGTCGENPQSQTQSVVRGGVCGGGFFFPEESRGQA
jgi:hypothetical protein